MKEKSYIKQKTLFGVLIAVIMAVAVIFGIENVTSAKAVSDSSGWTCNPEYDASSNRLSIAYFYNGSRPLSSPVSMKVTFNCGTRSWSYDCYVGVEYASSGCTEYINLSGNEFFAGGLTYSVSILFMDLEGEELDKVFGNPEPPIYMLFRDCYSFTISGDIVPLPKPPIKEGYHFVGWYYDEDFTQPYDNAPIYADTNLYAKMEINTYTVTFDSQCNIIVPSATVEWNSAVSDLPSPTRTGYDFIGWFTEDGTEYTNEPITENTTLYAHWEAKMFTVTFYLDNEVYTSLEVPYGSPLGDVMEKAEVSSFRALSMDGVRVSNKSVIQDNTDLLLYKLSGWEKYGDFVARNPWYTWLTLALVIALSVTAAVSIVIAVKRR